VAPGWAGPSTYARCPDNSAVNSSVAECFGLQAVRGKTMTGTELAMLIERMVTALNSRDIPSAGSMLEFFNKEVCRRSSRPLCRASQPQTACRLLFAMPMGSRGTMHCQPRPSACGDDGAWKELDCDAICDLHAYPRRGSFGGWPRVCADAVRMLQLTQLRRGVSGQPEGPGGHPIPQQHIVTHTAAQLLFACRDQYAAQLARLAIPVDEAWLEEAHRASEAAAVARFDREKFGSGRTSGAGALRDALSGAIGKEHECALGA